MAIVSDSASVTWSVAESDERKANCVDETVEKGIDLLTP